MLWEDSCPKKLSEYHTQISLVNSLKKLSGNIKKGGSFPNIILYGPEQSGKYTLAKCLIESVFGEGVYNTKDIEHSVKQNCSNYTIKITESNYHYETSLSGLQYADRLMLISLLDTYFTTADIGRNTHKLIIIKHFDELTKPAQYALRRRMEKGWGAVRYILIVRSNNKIEEAIRSRCLCLRVPKPTKLEIKNNLENLLRCKNIQVRQPMIDKAVELSDNIISNAIYYLSYMVESNSLDVECPIQTAISELINCLFKKKLPYDKIRDIIAKLQLSKISHTKIFSRIITLTNNHFKDEIYIHRVINLAAEYDKIASSTNKYSIAVETFVVSVYNMIKEISEVNTNKKDT